MYDLKNFRVVILLVFAACGFYKGKAMKKYGLVKRHGLRGALGPERAPLLAPPAVAPTFLGLCDPRTILGSEDHLRHCRDNFIRRCSEGSATFDLTSILGSRPIIMIVTNQTDINLSWEFAGLSNGCKYTMIPQTIRPGDTGNIVIKAPTISADRTAVFVTFTFPFGGGELRRAMVGVGLSQSLPFGDHRAAVATTILDEANVVRNFVDCKEGKGGFGQGYFNLIRARATSPLSHSTLGDFGIVAAVDQSRPWSVFANFTFVHVAFTRVERQLGVGQRPDDAAQTESAPPSRITSEGSGKE
jgi:hypothetical protein